MQVQVLMHHSQHRVVLALPGSLGQLSSFNPLNVVCVFCLRLVCVCVSETRVCVLCLRLRSGVNCISPVAFFVCLLALLKLMEV